MIVFRSRSLNVHILIIISSFFVWYGPNFILFLIFFSTFIYFGDRERQSMNRGGAEREGDTESEAGSRL